MNIISRWFNDVFISAFITFVYVMLNEILTTKFKLYFSFLFALFALPIIIFSQYHFNHFINLKSPNTMFYYGSMTTMLIAIAYGLNSIKFASFGNNFKYILMFIASFILISQYYIGKIKIGVIHSVTGATNAIPVVNMLKLQVLKANVNGGINGKKIDAEFIDGQSNPEVYKNEVKRMINEGIKIIFGAWTSNDRKAIKPIIEQNDALLFYPLQYEGLECSPNIIYTGSTPNQQLEVGVNWALHNLGKEFYLVGTDGVYARNANKIMRTVIEESGGKIIGEEYFPYGSQDYTQTIDKVMALKSCIVLNTINGSVANIAFFKTLYEKYIKKMEGKTFVPLADVYPVISFSITEHALSEMKPEHIVGHYAVWSYFQTIRSDVNKEFVNEYKSYYGKDAVINDPMESSYIGFNLWARAVSELDTNDDLAAIKNHMTENVYNAPEGEVILNNNHHLSKYVRVGMINKQRLFDIVYNTIGTVDPITWNKYLPGTKGLVCDHGESGYGSKFAHGPLTISNPTAYQVGQIHTSGNIINGTKKNIL
jgi:urea transport system substrate-binding protein